MFLFGFICGMVSLGAAAYWYDRKYRVLDQMVEEAIEELPPPPPVTEPPKTLGVAARKYHYPVRGFRILHGSIQRYEKDVRHRMSKYRLQLTAMEERWEIKLHQVEDGNLLTLLRTIVDVEVKDKELIILLDFSHWEWLEYPYYLLQILLEKFSTKLEEVPHDHKD